MAEHGDKATPIYRAPNDARIELFRIADRAGFVNFLAGKADIGGRGDLVLAGNMIPQRRAIRAGCHVAPFLRRLVFVGKSALRGRVDFQRVSLPCPRKAF
jgi:hypothetical protein